jgi:hypothetical protein
MIRCLSPHIYFGQEIYNNHTSTSSPCTDRNQPESADKFTGLRKNPTEPERSFKYIIYKLLGLTRTLGCWKLFQGLGVLIVSCGNPSRQVIKQKSVGLFEPGIGNDRQSLGRPIRIKEGMGIGDVDILNIIIIRVGFGKELRIVVIDRS